MCEHKNTRQIGYIPIKETVAASWFEYDDDGYPNEVLGDRTFTWHKVYDVCLDCGTVREFDGYQMVESYSDQVPKKIAQAARLALKK